MAYEMPVPRVETTHEQSTSTEKDEPPALSDSFRKEAGQPHEMAASEM